MGRDRTAGLLHPQQHWHPYHAQLLRLDFHTMRMAMANSSLPRCFDAPPFGGAELSTWLYVFAVHAAISFQQKPGATSSTLQLPMRLLVHHLIVLPCLPER